MILTVHSHGKIVTTQGGSDNKPDCSSVELPIGNDTFIKLSTLFICYNFLSHQTLYIMSR